MRAGKLRHLVQLQNLESGQDDYGAPFNEWADGDAVYASVEPLNGRELFSAQQVNAETTVRITMRYRPDITQRTRIKYRDKFFNIQTLINPEMRNRELILMCSEGLISNPDGTS